MSSKTSKGILAYYLSPFQNFAKFSGRARRREYWSFVLINAVLSGVLSAIGDYSLNLASLGGFFALLVFIPTLAVLIRRLHDVGKSGFYLLWGLIPIIGTIIVLLKLVRDSEYGINKYGENPKSM